MKNRLERRFDEINKLKTDFPKFFDDSLKVMKVKVNPNEMVFFYRNDQLIGQTAKKGSLLFCYDPRKGNFRVERVYFLD